MQQPSKLMNRNFFLLWLGQSVNQLGIQGFTIALLFWVKHATGSAAVMGLLQMMASLPAVLLSPIGGTFADRHSRRKILILGDAISGLAILSLAGLTIWMPDAKGLILVWLFGVSALVSLAGAFFNPAITAAIPDLVPQSRVSSANALAQLSIQLAAFVGPGIGGTLFRVVGASALFLVNGLTYLFASVSESFITIPQLVRPAESARLKVLFGGFVQDTLAGFRYVWRRAGLRELVFASAFLNFFTVPVIFLLPFYIEDTLKMRVDWYGYLLAVYAAGAMLGYGVAGAVPLRARVRGRLMIIFMIVESAGYGLLGLVRAPLVVLGLALIGGLVSGFVMVNITTLLQITTPGDMRGRVFGLLTTIAGGLSPIALGLTGVIADLTGQNVPLIYMCCGAIMGLLSLLVSLNPTFRNFLSYEPETSMASVLGTVD